MKSIIYEPEGLAKETCHNSLACNLWTGCIHGCTYCYVPIVLHKDREEFHLNVRPKEQAIERLEQDCKKLRNLGDNREIFLSFACDHFQKVNGYESFPVEALMILKKYNRAVNILTKSAIVYDYLHFIRDNGWKLGMSFSMWDSINKFEPVASLAYDRLITLREAHRREIYTWVSMEPVIDNQEAFGIVEKLRNYVDHWYFGKLNYSDRLNLNIKHRKIIKLDWAKFKEVIINNLLKGLNNYTFKQGS